MTFLAPSAHTNQLISFYNSFYLSFPSCLQIKESLTLSFYRQKKVSQESGKANFRSPSFSFAISGSYDITTIKKIFLSFQYLVCLFYLVKRCLKASTYYLFILFSAFPLFLSFFSLKSFDLIMIKL